MGVRLHQHRQPHPDLADIFSGPQSRYLYQVDGLHAGLLDYFGDEFAEEYEEVEFLIGEEEPSPVASRTKGTKLKPTNADRARVVQRGLEKKAPFSCAESCTNSRARRMSMSGWRKPSSTSRW